MNILEKMQAKRIAQFRWLCVFGTEPAVYLHEEPPKSLNANWMNEPKTWYPVCDRHHQWLHTLSREEAERVLKEAVDSFAY